MFLRTNIMQKWWNCFLNETDPNAKKLSCQCPYPWGGARCEERSVCFEFCFNGGVCTVVAGEPKCECDPEKYEGVRCQSVKTTTAPPTPPTTTNIVCNYLPADHCNTGTCVIVGDKAVCKCPSTHTGENCENEVGGAVGPGPGPGPGPGSVTNPPGPGAVTNPSSGNGGSANACSSNPCRNNRPCFENGNAYYCFCGTQFSGQNCENNNG